MTITSRSIAETITRTFTSPNWRGSTLENTQSLPPILLEKIVLKSMLQFLVCSTIFYCYNFLLAGMRFLWILSKFQIFRKCLSVWEKNKTLAFFFFGQRKKMAKLDIACLFLKFRQDEKSCQSLRFFDESHIFFRDTLTKFEFTCIF